MTGKNVQIFIIAVVFILSITAGALTLISSSSLPLQLVANAETIEVPNPLGYDDVKSLSDQLRSYLLMIVGGIAIVMIAVSGIMYIIGGSSGNDNLINMGKKGVIGAVAGLVIIMGASMILNEVYFIVTGSEHSFDNLSASQILVRLINFLLAIIGTLFIISMLIGGIWFFSAGADESKVELGKKTVTYSIIGIGIALAAMVVLRQVDRIITGG
jgi:hypothetical protein